MTSRIQDALADGSKRDYYSGALMALIGLGAVAQGVHYHVGTLTKMGPGFFPVALGVILLVLGVAIAASARRRDAAATTSEAQKPRAEWRGWICIVSSIVAFIVFGTFGGLLPATFAVVFISALGDRENNLKRAFALAAAMSVISVVVFWWALKLQFPLFTWG
jgi:Tripartite tricarboxylate transporter TctB family